MTDVAITPNASGPATPRALHVPPLLRFVVRRLALGLVTLVIASAILFLGTSVIPGSPAAAVLGRGATPETIAQVEHRVGYDKPLVERYVDWLGGMVQGSFGNSAVAAAQGTESPIWPEIREAFGNTVVLALTTAILLIPLSLVLGLISALHAGKPGDHLISTASLVLVALPEFVTAALLVALLAVAIPVLPPLSLLAPGESPLSHPDLLVLPVLTLLAAATAWTIRLVRVGTIEVLKADYVQMARLQGLPERKVLRAYVLRNSLAPSVQIFALSIQYLFGGVVVVETVFNYPGLGHQLVDSVQNHDNTMVLAIGMILAAIYILINIIADLIVVLLVPKLRTQP